jgi:hypothetical protein
VNLKGVNYMANAKCLCDKEDGTPCGYIGTEKSIGYHLKSKHKTGMRIGETWNRTEEPVNFMSSHSSTGKRAYTKRKVEGTNPIPFRTSIIRIPCILEVNVITGDKKVILSE